LGATACAPAPRIRVFSCWRAVALFSRYSRNPGPTATARRFSSNRRAALAARSVTFFGKYYRSGAAIARTRTAAPARLPVLADDDHAGGGNHRLSAAGFGY